MTETREKFYFVRHGQTDANINRLAAGAGWDIELNEAGHAQAHALAQSEAFKVCHDVKTICASPMIRARQTADALRRIIDAPITFIDDLKEWDLGDWERMSWNDLPNLLDPTSNPPNGESQMQFGERISKALAVALSHPGPVLIVAHGAVWGAVAQLLSLPNLSITNCELKQVARAHAADRWSLID